MADDPERDMYPTKETKSFTSALEISDKYSSPEKRFVHHVSQSDLEDQFYKFKEENFQLKKSAKKQEDELKRLATKMTRLLREKKSIEMSHSPGHKRDIELEEMVEDLQDKVRQLEKSNTQLREKVLVAKQQVIVQSRRPNPYSHVPPKVNSGSFKQGLSPYLSSANLREKYLQNSSRMPANASISPYAINLLEEARSELSNLKMLVSNQRNEIDMYQQENDILKQKLRMREIEFEDDLNNLKSQLTQKQRQHVQENLDLIRIHRELKQKDGKITSIQMQYSDLEEKMRILKLNHDHLVKDNDELSMRFKAEQKKNLELLAELQKAEINFSASSELQDRLKSLTKENDILRETNDKLINNALAVDKERSYTQSEQMLKEKISHLEASLEFHVKSKAELQDELIKEKGNIMSKDEAYKLLHDQLNLVKNRMEELEVKINILKTEEVDFEELQEALNLLKLKKTGQLEVNNKVKDGTNVDNNQNTSASDSALVNRTSETELEPSKNESDPSMVDERIEQLETRLKDCEADHLETIQELNNVREMLLSQCDINKSAQDEIKSLTEKLDSQKKEYQAKLEEYSHLLESRATHIQKLETQLNDVVFGIQTVTTQKSDSNNSKSSPVKLNKGENLFELHIAKIKFSNKVLQQLHNQNSKVFLTWNFYEFELQSTPVVPSNKPIINFTARYTVQADDYFLWYLHQNKVTLELHESLGMEYRTIASCDLSFSSIFEKTNDSKSYSSEPLIGIKDNKSINFGTLEFSVKMKIPMEEAIKSFKARIKALRYIQSNKNLASPFKTFQNESQGNNKDSNELHIKILRGINFKTGNNERPTTYCVYKFYDSPDQETSTVPSSDQPEYSDHHVFFTHVDLVLHQYLQSSNLNVYVFDENEPDISSHIGKACIPLLSLVQNKPIKGTFDLTKDGNTGYGSLEVLIYWQYDYKFTTDNQQISEQKYTEEVSPAVSVTSSSSISEDSDAEEMATLKVGPTPPIPPPRKSIPSRKETSTPLTKSSGIFSNSDGSTEILSPKYSPVLPRDTVPVLQQHEVSSSPENHNTSSSDQSIPDKTTEAKRNEAYWSDVMSDTDKRAYYEDTSEPEKANQYDDSDESETESDERMPMTRTPKEEPSQVPTITISVSYLRLHGDSPVLQDPLIKLLFIEYRFLDYPLEELETPFSLPITGAMDKIEFNFVKKFPLKLKDAERWSLLSNMFMSDAPESSHVRFTVVSEPPEDQELDCEDIGWGYVDFCEILKYNKDKINEDIEVYSTQDNETVIGTLNISVQALDVLLLLKKFAES